MAMAQQTPAQVLLQKTVRITLSLTPWAIALFLHYWLEYEEVWAVDMAFRPVISALILAVGLGVSLLVHSALSKAKR